MATVGIVGCGNISPAYLHGLLRQPGLKVAAVADADQARARQAAQLHGLTAADGVGALLEDPDIEIVVNITPPLAHAEVSAAALAAGKHVFTEKPLAATFTQARSLVERAAEAGLTIGSAPDTFLGAAGQTARAAVDSGLIGDVVGATAFVAHSQAELWHPNPTFLFIPGGGPALDMGPYYIAALVNLLGPVAEVYAKSRIGAAVRTVTAPDRLVESIDVQIPTHAGAVLTFASGVVGTVQMSFDVWAHDLPHIEVYGTRGTLSVPDPDRYDDPVRVRLHGEEEWRTLDPVIAPLTAGLPAEVGVLRGPGVADLAAALTGAPHRTSGAFALHLLEVLETIATGDGRIHSMTTTCGRPAPTTD